jgi:hypothetical protein
MIESKNEERQDPEVLRPDSANSKASKVGIEKNLDRSNEDTIELQPMDQGF